MQRDRLRDRRGTWLERHALFVTALGLGLLLSALYVRTVVDPEKRSLSVIVGVWPLKKAIAVETRRSEGEVVGTATFRIYGRAVGAESEQAFKYVMEFHGVSEGFS